MDTFTSFIKEGDTLQAYYQQNYERFATDNSWKENLLSRFSHDQLMQPAIWFEALAILEHAIESGADTEITNQYFHLIFKSYDGIASVNLNSDDYAFYWKKINQLFDAFAPHSTEALIEKALQQFHPRREYGDNSILMPLLEEAGNRGDETARIIWGYYKYLGLFGESDKEQGMASMDNISQPEAKEKAIVYKAHIVLREEGPEAARSLIQPLTKKELTPDVSRLVYELYGYLFEFDKEPESAATYYKKVLEGYCSHFAMTRLGILHYNNLIEGASQLEGLKLLEEAFKTGQTDIVRSLFYCYYNSGQEWQNNERAIHWLYKGYQYNDAYSAYQLANLFLYDEELKDTEKGLFYLDKAIEQEYPDAYITKANIYYTGNGVEKDIDQSAAMLKIAIDKGEGEAAYRLGKLYEEGELNGGESDYATALQYYEKAAELNNIYGIEMAGRYHLVGYAGEANPEKALEYYNKGVEMGSAYCMVELSLMYDSGNGVEADPQKTFEFASMAAQREYPYAYFLVGRCYRHEIGTEEDPDKAIHYLQLAADNQVAKGETELAVCYEEGYGVEPDNKKALEYMLRAAEQEYAYAQYKVGYYYMYGLDDDVPADNAEGLKWFLKAAEQEYPYAFLEIGNYYLYDYDEISEEAKAYPYYQKAAEQGYVNQGMGDCLNYGLGVEENEPEAFKYYLKAAEDGYARAMYSVASCYYYGTGTKENMQEAFRWFSDAATYEHTAAQYFKGKMLLNGEGCTPNMEEGIALLQQAAESDHASAQFELGNCYLVGKGVTPDEEKAMEYFELAADNGHEDALKITGRRRRK